jgi:hypothetical protein
MVRVVLIGDSGIPSPTSYLNSKARLELRAVVDDGRFSYLSQREVALHRINGNLIECASMGEAQAVVDLYNRIQANGGGYILLHVLQTVKHYPVYLASLTEHMRQTDPSWSWP